MKLEGLTLVPGDGSMLPIDCKLSEERSLGDIKQRARPPKKLHGRAAAVSLEMHENVIWLPRKPHE
eukprot:6192672-Pleurochrysis_carterae.AAC.1